MPPRSAGLGLPVQTDQQHSEHATHKTGQGCQHQLTILPDCPTAGYKAPHQALTGIELLMQSCGTLQRRALTNSVPIYYRQLLTSPAGCAQRVVLPRWPPTGVYTAGCSTGEPPIACTHAHSTGTHTCITSTFDCLWHLCGMQALTDNQPPMQLSSQCLLTRVADTKTGLVDCSVHTAHWPPPVSDYSRRCAPAHCVVQGMRV